MRVGLEGHAEQVAGANDPRHEGDVREPELAPGQERRRGECRVERAERLREFRLGPRIPAAQVVVGAREVVASEDAKPRSRARRVLGRQQRRLGVPLLEELVDHGRLGQGPAVLLQDRHTTRGIQLVQPGRPILQIDHDRIVGHALLGQHDPHPGAVRTAWGVDEPQHQRPILTAPSSAAADASAQPYSAPARPSAVARPASSSRAGGRSAGESATGVTARIAAWLAPV